MQTRLTSVIVILAMATAAFFVHDVLVGSNQAQANVSTNAVDNLRTGWYKDQQNLSPQAVTGSNFGKLFTSKVTGQVYAQPLVADSRLLVVTEANYAYGLDPVSGAEIWKRQVGVPWNPADLGCADLTPDIGITSTPVIDNASHTMYFTSKSYRSGASGPAVWRMFAVDTRTGQDRAGFPVTIQGVASNRPTESFDPTMQMQRPGLLLLDGAVYAAFGSHCGYGVYSGWLAGVSTSGQMSTMWKTVGSMDGGTAGIWQSGGGLISDGPGQIVVSTGNGYSPSKGPGKTTDTPNYGQAVVRLSVQPDKSLKPTDYFSPYDASKLNEWDADLGSGGPVGLPSQQFSAAGYSNLAVAAGKQGYVYLLDRDNLGGKGQAPDGGDATVARIGPNGGVWTKPSVWPGDGGWVYMPTASAGDSAGGSKGYMRAYKFSQDAAGKPTLQLHGSSADMFGFGSGSPIVTSDGTRSGSALVWIIWSPDGSGANAQLRAYDPLPNSSGQLAMKWSAPIGKATKFATPAVSDSRIYVPTRDGSIQAFGLSGNPVLSAAAVAFDHTTLGQSQTKNVVFTAQKALQIQDVTSNQANFIVNKTGLTLPKSLVAGQSITVPLIFKPQTTGLIAGTITATTNLGQASIGTSGTGRAVSAEINVSPMMLSFGGVDTGDKATATATFSNTGSQTATVTALKTPATPFTATGLPKVGDKILPGQSITATVSFSPTSLGDATDKMSLSVGDKSAEVPMSGTASLPSRLETSASNIDFGKVSIGTSLEKQLTLTNTGSKAFTLTLSKPPAKKVGFSADPVIEEGTIIQPGESKTSIIKFTPYGTTPVTDTWLLNGNDGMGQRTVTFSGSGAASSVVPTPGQGGWIANGEAEIIGSEVKLTGADVKAAGGSAWWPTPIDTSAGTTRVEFEADIKGGNGADGLTFALGDTAQGATASSVGKVGGGLGFAGIPGVAVGLDTYKNGADPSANFVGIGSATKLSTSIAWLKTTSDVPALRGNPSKITIEIIPGSSADALSRVLVRMNGNQVQEANIKVPQAALLGFTAANGNLTDDHIVRNVRIMKGLQNLPKLGAGWQANGSAQLPTQSGQSASLTTSTGFTSAGTIWNSTPVDTSKGYIRAEFDCVISNPNNKPGADGISFALGDVDKGVTQHSVGKAGGGLGFAGLAGVIVALDTNKNKFDPSANFVGVADKTESATSANWVWDVVNPNPGTTLRRAQPHKVVIEVLPGPNPASPSHVIVNLDGKYVIDTYIKVPQHALVGFSAGTGMLADNQSISNVNIVASS